MADILALGKDKRLLFLTVPHSGSRYVLQGVERATGKQARMLGDVENFRGSFEEMAVNWFIWGHTRPREQHLDKAIKWADKVVFQMREPIATWGTWYKAWQRASKPRERMLLASFKCAVDTIEKYSDKIILTRAEDGLAQYGLEDHERSYTSGADMPKAVKTKDITEVERICGPDHPFYRLFMDKISPMLEPIYGQYYDFWWKNGNRDSIDDSGN